MSYSSSEDVYEHAEEFATLFESLAKDLGIANRLSEVGISGENVELLATEAMKQTRLLPNNPREVKFEDAIRIYTQAL